MSDTPSRSDDPVVPTDAPAAERLFQAIFAGLPEGLVVLDPRGVHREVNASFSRLIGWERAQLVATGPPFPYVAPSHHEACEELVGLALRGRPANRDLVLIHRSGREVVTAVRASSIDCAEQGKCALLLFMDVTEQRRTEDALRASESRWRSVVENPFDFVCVVDREYRYVFVNHVEPGLRMEDLIGKARPLDFVEPEYHATMTAAFEKAFRDGVTTSFDVYSSVLDRWTNTVVAPIYEGSTVTSLCSLTRDVTSSKRAEQSLRRSQRLEMIGVIGSGLGRDLRAELEPITTNVSALMREAPQSGPLWARLADVARAATRADELLRRLGSFERSAPEARELIDVSDVAAEVVARAFEARHPGVRLSADIDPACPSISGVVWEIQRAIENVYDNARRALGARGGEISVSVSRVVLDETFAGAHGLRPGDTVKIAVRDTGPGMTPDTLSHAFEPVFTTWRDHGCSGLGLPMVQAIATRHGGAVVARSSRGEGTTVELFFPASDGGQATSKRPLRPKSRKILYIDDEAAVLKLTRRVLERVGHQVVTFQFPLEAVERLTRSPDEFDLVITDQIMPRLTGIELAEKLLRIAPGVPVLLVSGYCDPGLVMPANVLAYMQKPVPVETLLQAVESACARRR